MSSNGFHSLTGQSKNNFFKNIVLFIDEQKQALSVEEDGKPCVVMHAHLWLL